MTNWGAGISFVRARSGLNRLEFGLRIGEPDHVIGSWECDGCEPLIHTALQTSTRLGLRVDDLTSGVRPPAWDGIFHDTPTLGRGDTRWRANMIALESAAGSRAQLARDLLLPQATPQSWIHRHNTPVLRSAYDVREMTGVRVHTFLTETIDDAAATYAIQRAREKVRERMNEPHRSPMPVADLVGSVGQGPPR